MPNFHHFNGAHPLFLKRQSQFSFKAAHSLVSTSLENLAHAQAADFLLRIGVPGILCAVIQIADAPGYRFQPQRLGVGYENDLTHGWLPAICEAKLTNSLEFVKKSKKQKD